MSLYNDVYDLSSHLNPLGSSSSASTGGRREPPAVEQVQDLFRRDPNASHFVDSNLSSLVHLCVVAYPKHLELIQFLVESSPKSLELEDGEGRIPLELFLTKVEDKPIRTLQYLIAQNPQTLLHETVAAGQWPLHLACQVVTTAWHVDWERDAAVIDVLLQGFPEAALLVDHCGQCPLHYALEPDRKGHVPVQAIQLLLERAPNVLRDTLPNARGQLPLHQAVASPHASSSPTLVQTVQLLAEHFPKALLLQDANNNTPLLDACVNDRPLDIVYTLVRQWPEQVMVNDSNINSSTSASVFNNVSFNGELLPISIASQSATLERVQAWVQRQPPSAFTTLQREDAQGRSPLHFAAASQSPHALEIVRCLVPHCPASAADVHGRLPLHYAVLSQSADVVETVVDELIQQFPPSLVTEDGDCLLPWHYAACAHACFGSSRVEATLYERTLQFDPGLHLDSDLIPYEVHWDLLQVSPRQERGQIGQAL